MLIQHIYAENYKTYLHLDLDISVSKDRPIVLIGGANGGGKTTLFDAIKGALYGLDIDSEHTFRELFNAGVKDYENKAITLMIQFTGEVQYSTQQFKLRRIYKVINHKPVESVRLDFGSATYEYGSATPPKDKATQEMAIGKIIEGNLPRDLSNYFLFDAMKSSDLVKENSINTLIQNNINKVMGFGKYSVLCKASEKLLGEEKAKRLEDEKQEREYKQLMTRKSLAESELMQLKSEYDKHLQYSNKNKDLYDQQKKGKNNDEIARNKIDSIKKQLANLNRAETDYRTRLNTTVKDLETDVIIPKLASVIAHEIEQILNVKESIEEQSKGQFTEQQVQYMTQKIVDIIEGQYVVNGKIEVNDIVQQILDSQDSTDASDDPFSYLDRSDVDTLKEMLTSNVNPMLQIDESKNNLDVLVEEEPNLKDNMAVYERQLSGNDYELIKAYEQNEQAIYDLKEKISQKQKDIEKINKKLQTYDYQVNQIPDLKYDTLCKLPQLFKELYNTLLKNKKGAIEKLMCKYLNQDLVSYKGTIKNVELSQNPNDNEIKFKMYHTSGNEIYLSQLNTGSKQMVMQVLLKVLYELGDYNPPIMIDTVMGVLDKASRETVLEDYFPDLADQTILLSTDTEITAENDFAKIEGFVSKAYTLHRDLQKQCTTITEDYFGLKPNKE